MRFFNKTPAPEVVLGANEKTWDGEATVASESQHAAIDSEAISAEAQKGVQGMEAITSAWTKRDLIIAYVL
jgi:hypothetical protein